MKMAKDSAAKKEWDKKNMVFVGFKLFRANQNKENDQAIINFLSKQESKGEAIKKALDFYIKNHKEENK